MAKRIIIEEKQLAVLLQEELLREYYNLHKSDFQKEVISGFGRFIENWCLCYYSKMLDPIVPNFNEKQ